MNDWYSSPGLFVQLLQAEINVCGTVRLNRKGMPPDFSEKKLKHGEIAFYSSTDGLLALKWQDKKGENAVFNAHSRDGKYTEKAQKWQRYN